ncbi:MAG: hypothetical protein R3F65_17605 [bacterium]
MIALPLIIALLAPPAADGDAIYLGARAGAGVIEAEPYLVLDPWAGWQRGDFAIAVHAPLRVRFDDATLRARDWDEGSDFGRLLRFARYGEWVRVGLLADLTLGQGTLVRRYHNGVDDDHHRLGAAVEWRGEALRLDAFADQVLAAPVAGLRVGYRFTDRWSAALTAAADFAAPHSLDGTADSTGRLRGDTGLFLATGAEAAFDLVPPEPDHAATAYLAVNLLDADRIGAHLGFGAAGVFDEDWRVEGRLEGIALGEGYLWSPFDTGWLVDRYRRLVAAADALDPTLGGRAALTVAWGEAVVVGAEYADALTIGRADLSAWLQVPLSDFTLAAYWRQRAGPERLSVFDPEEALAAAAATMTLSPGWYLDVTLARVWRVVPGEPEGPPADPEAPGAAVGARRPVLAPTTEFFVTLEAAFGL